MSRIITRSHEIFDARFKFWTGRLPESVAFSQTIWEMDGQIRRAVEAGATKASVARRVSLTCQAISVICHKKRRMSPAERYFRDMSDVKRLISSSKRRYISDDQKTLRKIKQREKTKLQKQIFRASLVFHRFNTMKTSRLVKSPGLWGVDSEIRDLPLFQKYGDIPAVEQQPTLVSIHRRPVRASDAPEKSYEEANWAKLSPQYRAAHNRLRQSRGQTPIPDPQVDLYIKPPPSIRPFNPADREVIAAGRGFLGTTIMGMHGDEGFTINGKPAKI